MKATLTQVQIASSEWIVGNGEATPFPSYFPFGGYPIAMV
jgi:hypothetical protein